MTCVASADIRGVRRSRPVARFAGAVAVAAAGLSFACAPTAGIVLPAALSGTPDTQVAVQADAARQACEAAGAYSAEIAVSGRVGGSRIRARLLAGFADGGRARREALAPFGQPVFILVTAGGRGTVVLPRDRKVVRDVPAADLLAALTGIAVDGADLAALLSGCVVRDGGATDGRQLPNGWAAATLGGGRATAFLRAVSPGSPPKIVAGRLTDRASAVGFTVGYDRFAPDGLPRHVRIERSAAGDTVALELSISQLDTAVVLEEQAFRVIIPQEFSAVTLAEIRRAGPLAQER